MHQAFIAFIEEKLMPETTVVSAADLDRYRELVRQEAHLGAWAAAGIAGALGFGSFWLVKADATPLVAGLFTVTTLAPAILGAVAQSHWWFCRTARQAVEARIFPWGA